ncbi:MAG: hypothetical protein HUJ56_12570 [Erysipelotrichaceae bacterium]|nr:hypothetical protein [Erysipelotrichaceae bacterium]
MDIVWMIFPWVCLIIGGGIVFKNIHTEPPYLITGTLVGLIVGALGYFVLPYSLATSASLGALIGAAVGCLITKR